jgi:hypothetical protein
MCYFVLDDIIIHQDKSAYRLGTLVVHQEDKNGAEIQNIVDGQQRPVRAELHSVPNRMDLLSIIFAVTIRMFTTLRLITICR